MGFVTGVACVVRGLAKLVSSPSLWGYAVAPIVVTLAFLTALSFAADNRALKPIETWLRGVVGDSAWTGWAFRVLFYALWAVILLLVFSACVRVVAAPFLALLADRTVAQVSGAPVPPASGGPVVRWVVRPFVEALCVVGLRLAITVAALPLLLIPFAGGTAFGAISLWLVGLDFLDVALSARGVLLGARLRFVRSHAGACLGLGVVGGLLLLIPCINALLLPAIVVAAVLLDQALSPDFPRAPVSA